MNAMLTKYLKDFSVPQPVTQAGKPLYETLADAPLADFDFHSDPVPQIDIEAERQEAYDEGYRDAKASLESQHQEDIETLRQAHEFQLHGLADAHESETVWMIHTRFHEMTQAISQSVTEHALQILTPILDEEVCRRAISRLSDLVQELLRESSATMVVIRGPERLYARLKPMLEVDGLQTRFVETDSADISVEVDETVLVTRLANWAQALAEVSA